MTVLLPLLLALIAVPVVLAGGRLRPALAAPLAVLATLLATAALFYSWTLETTEITLLWVPTLAMQLAFQLARLFHKPSKRSHRSMLDECNVR